MGPWEKLSMNEVATEGSAHPTECLGAQRKQEIEFCIPQPVSRCSCLWKGCLSLDKAAPFHVNQLLGMGGLGDGTRG